MARERDYRAEYQRRIARGVARGLTRAQSRGHARSGETPPIRSKVTGGDQNLEAAFTALRKGASLSRAAKGAHVSRERLRRFVDELGLAEWKSRNWLITDKRPRRVTTISKGKLIDVVVPDLENAARAGAYWDAQGRFVRSNNIDLIKPFEGTGVTDIKGRFRPFETDPNEIHRIASMDTPVFHEVYQITSN